MCEKDRDTEGDEDRLPYWPIASVSSLDYIMICYLQAFSSLLLLVLGHRPMRTVAPLGPGRSVSATDRIKTQDSRRKTPHICCGTSRYNFTTPTHSNCHLRDVLPLIYTGASCYHIVYTAVTSGSVKGQYATHIIYYYLRLVFVANASTLGNDIWYNVNIILNLYNRFIVLYQFLCKSFEYVHQTWI